MTEESSNALAPVTVAAVVSLVLTGMIVFGLCRPPLHPSLTWLSLSLSAFSFILVAAAANFFWVWCLCRFLKEEIGTSIGPVIAGVWTAAAWLPLLALLVQENSVLVASVPPLIAISAALFLRRWKLGAEWVPAALDSASRSTLFRVREEPSLLRAVLPAAASSLAFQAAWAVLLLGHSLIAGLLFAVCIVVPVWIFPARMHSGESSRAGKGGFSSRSFIAISLIAILLTGVALMPFLTHSHFAKRVSAFLQTTRVNAASKTSPKSSDAWDYYSGVILVLPVKPHKEIVAPAPTKRVVITNTPARPVIIPFDGMYWYFKRPDHRPKPDSRIVRGDPMKANIHSTDSLPLSMEAHQHMGSYVQMSCCSEMRLAVRNADDRFGTISLEVLLRDTASKGAPAQSLGSVVIRSSQDRHIPLNRPPVDEVLHFTFPRSPQAKQFDEITVVIRPARERERAGAHIAVEYFELLP
jgi:hypothetical protein